VRGDFDHRLLVGLGVSTVLQKHRGSLGLDVITKLVPFGWSRHIPSFHRVHGLGHFEKAMAPVEVDWDVQDSLKLTRTVTVSVMHRGTSCTSPMTLVWLEMVWTQTPQSRDWTAIRNVSLCTLETLVDEVVMNGYQEVACRVLCVSMSLSTIQGLLRAVPDETFAINATGNGCLYRCTKRKEESDYMRYGA
jgi:hypothetical protein